eukprot:TRINITY_DN1344_c0_g1_i1.p1 TRINITY_DN1344_c0_g1~~TRINITY_DN1344_c0_g1_i1.p1  ORF type:complete len:101 (-),score=19.01 TRINITY_DN1344_c0_g1_i1:86-388(-)
MAQLRMRQPLLMLPLALLCAFAVFTLETSAWIGSGSSGMMTRARTSEASLTSMAGHGKYGRSYKKGPSGPRPKKIPNDINFEYIRYSRQGKKTDAGKRKR